MNTRKVLISLMKEIADEAERNPAFMTKLQSILEPTAKGKSKAGPGGTSSGPKAAHTPPKRPSNRRQKAEIDPVSLARVGEEVLRSALSKLDIEKLRDVVAEYGMDTGKIVMKWRTPDRIIDRIVEISRLRAQKGNAFRDHSAVEPSQLTDAVTEKSSEPDQGGKLPPTDTTPDNER